MWKWTVPLALMVSTVIIWPALGAPFPESDEPLPAGAVARFGSTKLRTTATDFALSVDGKILHTVAGGHTIGRWDTKTGRLLSEAHVKTPFGTTCWFSPDRQLIAAFDTEGVGLYNAETGERLRTVARNDPSGMLAAAFSPDGLHLATSEYESNGNGQGVGRVWLYPVSEGKPKLMGEFHSYINVLAFSPDGKHLYAAVDNHSLRCIDTATAKELWKNDHWARNLAVSPDGKMLASDTYQDGPLRLWNAATGEAIATLDSGKRSWPRALAFGPDGKTVGFGTNDAVQIWDVASKKLLHLFAGAGPDLAFAPDGGSVFTVGPLIERWDMRTGKSLYPETRSAGHIGPVNAVAFAPDGRSLASTGSDGTLRVWNRAKGKHKVHKVRLGAGCPLAYAPDGQLLTLGAGLGTLALRDADSGKAVREFAIPQKAQLTSDVFVARLSDNDKILLTIGHLEMPISGRFNFEQRELLIGWDFATGKTVFEKSIPSLSWTAAFSPSGRFLAREGHAELLDVGTGRSRPLAAKSPPPFRTCLFSPDGRWLATLEPSDGDRWHVPQAVLVYEVLTGRLLTRLKPAACHSMAFSPDGRLLVANDTDALDVWQVSTGQKLLSVPAKGRLTNWAGSQFANCLAFAPDGQSVATGHGDGTVLVWDMAPAWKAVTAPKGVVDQEACWKELANPDPKVAWAAVERLAPDPTAALELLNEQLKPVTLDAKWVAERIAELSSDDFKTREKATAELKKVADVARPLLVEARGVVPSAEGQRRLDEVLEYAPAVPPNDTIRSLRALAILERINTKEAVDVLKTLAGGAENAELTREARATVQRLQRR